MQTVPIETSLSEEQVIGIIHAAVEKLFPKNCTSCGRRFNSMKEFLENTTHVGEPCSYDAEMQDWQPSDPLGTFSFSDCECGTTIALASNKVVNTETMWQLLAWVKKESQRREISTNQLLSVLRVKMNDQVLKSQK